MLTHARPRDRATTAPGDGADGRLAAIEQRLARVEAIVAASGPRDEADAALLHVLCDCTRDHAFTASEVLTHARLAPRLAAALENADIDGTIQLGLLLRRLVGATVDELLLVATPTRTRDGRVYAWVTMRE